VVTNKPARLTEPLLAALNLAARAACIVSGDTIAERKPHPAPLQLAAQRIGIPAEHCLYLGDALRDVQAAIAAGMLPLGARFGYLDVAEQPDRWPVAGWIDRPSELLPWLGLRLPL
jgi:phosphoglycolate phosphatase